VLADDLLERARQDLPGEDLDINYPIAAHDCKKRCRTMKVKDTW